MSESAPAIELRSLSKTYRSAGKTIKEALKSVDLVVPRGSFYGLLGPNGAGKSTLINILSGTVIKTAGEASICGYNIQTQTREAKESIGIVPQELVLDPFFPPYEALEFYAGLYGIPRKERRTNEILEAVGLTEHARKYARKLSGGMRRRLLVAKALVHNPSVLILDEPTAGVDVELRDQLWDYVKKLNENGTTILLTTHYLEEAETLCDHISVINHGEVIVSDSKENLIQTIDQKVLEITPATAIETVPDSLEGLETEIAPNGNLLIRYQSKQQSFDQILSRITQSSIVIKDLTTKEADLEKVFRHLTKKAA